MTYYTRYPRPSTDHQEAQAARQHLLDGLMAAINALQSAEAAVTVELNCWHDYRSCGCWPTPEGAGDFDRDAVRRQLDAWREELEGYFREVANADPVPEPLRPSAT
jgi:hypothetical protein